MEIEKVHESEYREVMSRVRRTSVGAFVVFGIGVFWWGGWRSLAGLTCSATVVMINFFWLEEIIQKTLQPVPQVESWRVVARLMARFALLGLVVTFTIVIARFEVVGVILGFSVIVVGIMGEAVWSVVKSLRQGDIENGSGPV